MLVIRSLYFQIKITAVADVQSFVLVLALTFIYTVTGHGSHEQ